MIADICYEVFFAVAARAFAAFFWLLLIMTMLKNDPTTAEPNSIRITGILIAHTRGGNRSWRGWPESTKGYRLYQMLGRTRIHGLTRHQQGPDRIVKESRSGYDQHSQPEELVQLVPHQWDVNGKVNISRDAP